VERKDKGKLVNIEGDLVCKETQKSQLRRDLDVQPENPQQNTPPKNFSDKAGKRKRLMKS